MPLILAVVLVGIGLLAIATMLYARATREWALFFRATVPIGFIAIAFGLTFWPRSADTIAVCQLIASLLALIYGIELAKGLTSALSRVAKIEPSRSDTASKMGNSER